MNFPADFSLVLCTLNRTDAPILFLKSLAAQTGGHSIQLIVVDQNKDDRMDGILSPYLNLFDVVHLRTTPGLSHARNLGLEHATGNIIAFPDDDCTYPPNLLDSVFCCLKEHLQWDGITTKVTDDNGKLSVGYMYPTDRPVTRKCVWDCAVSVSIFIRSAARGDVKFNEALGVGSGTKYGSGEETDFVLNLLRAGKKLQYQSGIAVHHPQNFGPWKMRNGYLYGCGMGYVLRKHGWGVFAMLYYVARQGVRAAQSLCLLKFSKMMFHLAMSYGRVCGYFSTEKD